MTSCVFGAKEHPGDDDRYEDHSVPGKSGRHEPRRDRRAVMVPAAIDAEIDAMQRSPGDQGSGRAVAEATERHRDYEVDIAE
jgi:hypothetical protein